MTASTRSGLLRGGTAARTLASRDSGSSAFSVVERVELSTWQKLALACGSVPTNVGWALSESLMIPYLMELECPYYVCTWVWLFSPLLSAYAGPRLDALSDNWKTTNRFGWRGRKQPILALSLVSAVTMLLIPRSHWICQMLFHSETTVLVVCLATCIFSVMDLSHYLLLRPLQSLVWDVTLGDPDVYGEALETMAIVQGLSRVAAYALTAVLMEWHIFGCRLSHISAIWSFAAALILCAALFCVICAPNPPEYSYYETTDDLVRAELRYDSEVSRLLDGVAEDGGSEEEEVATVRSTRKSTVGSSGIGEQPLGEAVGLRLLDSVDDDPSVMSETEMTRLLATESDRDRVNFSRGSRRRSGGGYPHIGASDDDLEDAVFGTSVLPGAYQQTDGSFVDFHSDTDINVPDRNGVGGGGRNGHSHEEEVGVSEAVDHLEVDDNLSMAFYVVLFSQFCGWVCVCSVVLFWTSFCGVDVYDGEPRDNAHDHDFKAFENGLVFGVFGLVLLSLVATNCSLMFPSLDALVGSRTLFLTAQFMMCFICIAICFTYRYSEITLLCLIALFGFAMELHMQSSLRLSEAELKPVYIAIQRKLEAENVRNAIGEEEVGGGSFGVRSISACVGISTKYLIELGGVLAPFFVALIGGPIVYFTGNQFRWMFLLPAVLMFPVDIVVALIFGDFIDWRLPVET